MISESITELTLPYDDTEKSVRVYVPAHEEGETLPVIYMTDGQNLFEDTDVRFGCWYTREAVRAERKLSGEAAIIVGISNDDTPLVRTNDLTPLSIGELVCPEEVKQALTPKGELFDAFIVDTVKPAVEERFPVKTGRKNTALCGSSSGGLEVFFTAVSHPDLFCASGVFSPAFIYYMPEDVVRWTCSKMRDEMPYLYLYCGGSGEQEEMMCRWMERVYDMLLECYPPERLNEIILPQNKHHEEAWAEIFKDFLHTFLVRREEF